METHRIRAQVEETREADDCEEKTTLTQDPGRGKDLFFFSLQEPSWHGAQSKGYMKPVVSNVCSEQTGEI